MPQNLSDHHFKTYSLAFQSILENLNFLDFEISCLVLACKNLVSGMTNFLFLALFPLSKIAYSTANI